MCPTLSCCHLRPANPSFTQLLYLGRLLLASGSAELLPDELPCLETRLAWLRTQLQQRVPMHRHLSAGQALALTERWLLVLLRRPCCRLALRRTVPLPEALGPAVHFVSHERAANGHAPAGSRRQRSGNAFP